MALGREGAYKPPLLPQFLRSREEKYLQHPRLWIGPTKPTLLSALLGKSGSCLDGHTHIQTVFLFIVPTHIHYALRAFPPPSEDIY